MSSRHDDERLIDIINAIDAIRSHLARGDLSDGLIFDAVRVRLIEIGEAVKALDPELVASQPNVKWSDAAGMRDWLAHHYFDTSRATIEATIMEDLPPLETAVRRLQTHRKPTEKHPGSLPGKDFSLGS
ncbi:MULTISPECIES: HepT-like ribonuclease domain-containing protein [Ferrimicrobium]|uniref:HepT-like ribonuclease domain-containing protein n=1 Tax=Ferrimicrobium TaxID=121038 RepID=UPI0023F06155|nr:MULTISPECIES: HepT-like ribonuclease domain-containing protein [Ferrimicrobium]